MSKRGVPCLLVVLLVTASRLDAYNANEATGLPTYSIQTGSTLNDSINTYSGDLEISIPIGPRWELPGMSWGLSLNYSSKIWRIWHLNPDPERSLSRRGAFGVGWHLGMGRVFQHCRYACGQMTGFYFEDERGTLHPIHLNLGLHGQLQYTGKTTDGTYMRVLVTLSEPTTPADPNKVVSWQIWTGDGIEYVFDVARKDTDPHPVEHDDRTGWMTSRILRHGPDPNAILSRVEVDYDLNHPHCIDQIQDFIGSSATPYRTVDFVNESTKPGWGGTEVEGGFTSEIILPAVDGQSSTTARYTFSYLAPQTLELSNYLASASIDDQILLSSASPKKADGSSIFDYAFEYDSGSGELTEQSLVSAGTAGATVAYEYDAYDYLNYGLSEHYVYTRMVKRKTVTADSISSVWTYTRHATSSAEQNPVKWFDFVIMKDPMGNQTKYINYSPYFDGSAVEGLTRQTEYYRGSPLNSEGAAAGDGELVRWVEHIYQDYGSLFDPTYQTPDVRLTRTRTTYPEVGKEVRVLNEAPVPYGHFEVTKEFGFESQDIPERTTQRLYIEPQSGPMYANWVKDALTESWIEDGSGSVLRKSWFTYEDDGKLKTVRRAVAPPAQSTADIVQTFNYDPDTGLLESNSVSGGDDGSWYGTRFYHTGPYITQKVTLALDPNDQEEEFSYFSFDVDRDPATGLILMSRDPSGIATSYWYDARGRLTRIEPSGVELPTEISYPSIWESRVVTGDPNSDRIEQRNYLDKRGRHVERRRWLSASQLVSQRMCYDKLDRQTYVSEWATWQAGSPPCPSASGDNLGTYYDYSFQDNGLTAPDPFGRIHKVTRADGATTEFAYSGTDSVATIRDINASPGTLGSASSVTRQRRDAFGRLTYVDSPEGADARYIYDAVGDILRVELVEGDTYYEPFIQHRTYDYDGLGQVRVAISPEEGTVLYVRYDAEGRLLEKVESDGTRVTLDYDAAGRLALVEQEIPMPGGGFGPLTPRAAYEYDDALVTNGLGRLTRVWSFDETGSATASRRFFYDGLNGRLGQEKTQFSLWDGLSGFQAGDPEFTTCYTYNELGLPAATRYPATADCSTYTADQVANLSYLHSFGMLKRVNDSRRNPLATPSDPNWSLIRDVLYNDAGGVKEVAYANGVTNIIEHDSMYRPRQIRAKHDNGQGSVNWLLDTGFHEYDGAGNISYIGYDFFEYDLAGRLTHMWMYDDNVHTAPAQAWFEQWWEYDDFGNILAVDSNNNGASASQALFSIDPYTNRILTQSGSLFEYDQRGNLREDIAQRYLFDSRNRLAAVKHDSKTYPIGVYAYDAGGMRFYKESPETGERIFYVRDSEGNVLSEFIPSGAGLSAGFWQKDYFYALGRVIGKAEELRPKPLAVKSYMTSPAIGPHWVTLEFPAVEADVTGFRIYKKEWVGGWVPIATVATPALQWQDPNMIGSGEFRHYRIAALRGTDESVTSRGLRMQPFATLQAPDPNALGLTVTATEHAVVLSWERAPGDNGPFVADPATVFQGYNVWRTIDPNSSSWAKLNTFPLTGTTFYDLGVSVGQTYFYELRGVSTDGSEDWGELVSATPQDGMPPAVPLGVRATPGPLANEVTVAWWPSSESDLQEFRIWRLEEDPNGGPDQLVLRGTASAYLTAWTDSGLTLPAPGESYVYAVSAKDYDGNESSKSPTVEARPRVASPQAPQIEAHALLGLYGASAFIAYGPAGINAAEYDEFRLYRREVGDPEKAWDLVHSAPVSHVYPPEGEEIPPTHAFDPDYVDLGVDRCRVYDYIVNGISTSGEETEDSLVRRLEWILEPNIPTVHLGVAGKVHFNAEGFKQCSLVGSAYEVLQWKLIQQRPPTDPNYTPPPNTFTFDPAAGFINVNPPVDPNGLAVWAYALRADIINLYETTDPNNPVITMTFMSQDVCVDENRQVVDDDTACPDLDGSQPFYDPNIYCCAPPQVFGDTWQEEEMGHRMPLVLRGGGRRASVSNLPEVIEGPPGEAGWRMAKRSDSHDDLPESAVAEATITLLREGHAEERFRGGTGPAHRSAGVSNGQGREVPVGLSDSDIPVAIASLQHSDLPGRTGRPGRTLSPTADAPPAGGQDASGRSPDWSISPEKPLLLEVEQSEASGASRPIGITPPAADDSWQEPQREAPGSAPGSLEGSAGTEGPGELLAARFGVTSLLGVSLEAEGGLNSVLLLITGATGKAFEWEFFSWDHLGTVRVITNEAGQKTFETKHLPFSEEMLGQGLAVTGNTHRFTGHERDESTRLDYMFARYYGSDQHRFLAADPVTITSLRLHIPLRFNRYSYATNNPVGYRDDTGEDVTLASRDVDWSPAGNHAFFIITPTGENATRFANLVNSSTGTITLSGFEGEKGKLTGKVNDKRDIGREDQTVELTPPEGQTMEQFEANVIEAFQSYPNNQPYGPTGSGSGEYNSNGLASGILEAAGADSEEIGGELRGWHPGWGKGVPLPDATRNDKGKRSGDSSERAPGEHSDRYKQDEADAEQAKKDSEERLRNF